MRTSPCACAPSPCLSVCPHTETCTPAYEPRPLCPLCTQSQNGACQIVDFAERGLSVLIFMPSGPGPFAVSGHQRQPHPLPRIPTILAGIPRPLTGVIRDAGPLAAGWRAEHIIAVHEEALIVLPTLGVHDGDVRDDGAPARPCPPCASLPPAHWTWVAWAGWPG